MGHRLRPETPNKKYIQFCRPRKSQNLLRWFGSLIKGGSHASGPPSFVMQPTPRLFTPAFRASTARGTTRALWKIVELRRSAAGVCGCPLPPWASQALLPSIASLAEPSEKHLCVVPNQTAGLPTTENWQRRQETVGREANGAKTVWRTRAQASLAITIFCMGIQMKILHLKFIQETRASLTLRCYCQKIASNKGSILLCMWTGVFGA